MAGASRGACSGCGVVTNKAVLTGVRYPASWVCMYAQCRCISPGTHSWFFATWRLCVGWFIGCMLQRLHKSLQGTFCGFCKSPNTANVWSDVHSCWPLHHHVACGPKPCKPTCCGVCGDRTEWSKNICLLQYLLLPAQQLQGTAMIGLKGAGPAAGATPAMACQLSLRVEHLPTGDGAATKCSAAVHTSSAGDQGTQGQPHNTRG